MSGLALAVSAGAQSRPTDTSTVGGRPVVVASKPFGESYLLCEMFAQLLESRGMGVERRPGLGATEIAFGALRSGAIDVYPEYTGTGLVAVLHDSLPDSVMADSRAVFAHVARRFFDEYGVLWLPPLGFQNTYAIAVSRATANKYHLRTLSDLARESPHLTAGFTADFIGRSDGLVGLSRVYGLRPRAVRPLAPAVKYQALASGAVDVIDGYSTDGLLARYDLITLIDDRHFFPPYEAAALVAGKLEREMPSAIAALTLLSGRLDETTMRQLNRRVEVDGEDVRVVAADELKALGLIGGGPTTARVERSRSGAPAAGRARASRSRNRGGSAWALSRAHPTACRANDRRAGGASDDSQHRTARVHDSFAGCRCCPGARGVMAVRSLSNRPRNLHGSARRGSRCSCSRGSSRHNAGAAAALGPASAGRAGDHGWNPNCRCHHGRSCDACRVYWCRRSGRTNRCRTGARGHAHDFVGCSSSCSARARCGWRLGSGGTFNRTRSQAPGNLAESTRPGENRDGLV